MHPKAKTIVLFHDDHLTPGEEVAAISAIELFIKSIGLDGILKFNNAGNWYFSGRPHESLAWYLAKAYQPMLRDSQLNATTIIRDIANSPHREDVPNYPVIVTEFDIYDEAYEESEIGGIASEGVGTVISTYRTRASNHPNTNCFQLARVIIHELGHVFGMCNPKRAPQRLVQAGGHHCSNTCAMRQVLRPGEGLLITRDMLNSDGKPFCDDCLKDLFLFFA
ncbi:MAG: hypothetical protein Q8O93_05735 [bacterium]|nr:hypothetical protein [bacterium]